MRKIWYIFKEMMFLIRRHKLYFIAPLLIVLLVLVVLALYVGPTAIVTFIYAGL